MLTTQRDGVGRGEAWWGGQNRIQLIFTTRLAAARNERQKRQQEEEEEEEENTQLAKEEKIHLYCTWQHEREEERGKRDGEKPLDSKTWQSLLVSAVNYAAGVALPLPLCVCSVCVCVQVRHAKKAFAACCKPTQQQQQRRRPNSASLKMASAFPMGRRSWYKTFSTISDSFPHSLPPSLSRSVPWDFQLIFKFSFSIFSYNFAASPQWFMNWRRVLWNGSKCDEKFHNDFLALNGRPFTVRARSI